MYRKNNIKQYNCPMLFWQRKIILTTLVEVHSRTILFSNWPLLQEDFKKFTLLLPWQSDICSELKSLEKFEREPSKDYSSGVR